MTPGKLYTIESIDGRLVRYDLFKDNSSKYLGRFLRQGFIEDKEGIVLCLENISKKNNWYYKCLYDNKIIFVYSYNAPDEYRLKRFIIKKVG